MTGKPDIPISDFGASFKGFLDQMAAQAPSKVPEFARIIKEHFGTERTDLPIVTERYDESEQPNIQKALDSYFSEEGRTADLFGVVVQHEFMGVSLSTLLTSGNSSLMGGSASPTPGPVQFDNVLIGDDTVLSCVRLGLYLVKDRAEKLAVFLSRGEMSYRRKLEVSVMATEKSTATGFLTAIRNLMKSKNVYRGHVVSLNLDQQGATNVQFHRLPAIDRNSIIFPNGLLERIERHTIVFGRHSKELRNAGRHLKRGLLLYGPPGTGKTFSAMYLAAQMPDRTTILLTGRSFGLIGQSCAMARTLQPSMVILEDVDLVAEERTRYGNSCQVLLFELLNEMDGLGDDADVIFLLTTNRADILEPALASRPGRIDQAIEVPLPDAECRKRLFELYSKGLNVRVENWDQLVRKTEGVSPAFIKELLRKASLFAAETNNGMIVEERHMDDALFELVVHGGQLTQSLLGGKIANSEGAVAT